MTDLMAIDLMKLMPPMQLKQMAADPRNTAQALFALTCAVEVFLEVVDERFVELAEALSTTALDLYETMQENTLGSTSRWVMEPDAVAKAYQRFENIYVCLEQLSEEIGERWQTLFAWQNIQVRFRPLKAVLVHNCRYQPDC